MGKLYLDSDIKEVIENLGDTARAFEGKTILLTGGRGFLGRYFTAVFHRMNREVFQTPCRVIAADNLITSGEGRTESEEAPADVFIEHNVIQPLSIDEPVDYIMHAAGIASPYYYRKYPIETLEVATHGTRNMLDLAREKGARLVFFSSSEIYGDPDPNSVPTTEDYRGNVSTLGPRACYDEGKRVGETFCRVYFDYFQLSNSIIRPFNVYGPGMGEHDYRVLPNFANRIAGGKPLLIYGTGRQTRTFCYVSDAITGFLRVLADGHPGEAYNIGNPAPEVSMLDLAEHIRKALQRPIEVERVDYPASYPPDEPQRRCPDISKAQAHLGYAPKVGLAEGLRRFFSWTGEVYTGE